jgi:hypothetical protein
MHRRILHFALTTTLACLAAAAMAAPAFWYQWRSQQTSDAVCSQTPLGEGWVRADGPYYDSGCRRRVHLIKLQ